MYRSYSVNDMPQPIRYPADMGKGNGMGNRPSGRDKDIHTNSGRPCPPESSAASECQSRAECPPPAECPSPAECPLQTQNLPQNCPYGGVPSVQNCNIQNCPARCAHPNNNGGLLAGLNLKSDDLILLAVAVILLMDGCDDKLLIAALGLVFFSDYFGLGNT